MVYHRIWKGLKCRDGENLTRTKGTGRYEGGLIMVRKGDLQRVTDLVKEYGAEYKTWEVVPDDEEKKQLQLQAV